MSNARVLSVPGKTFFLGEYLALDGGPSIVVSTRPRFVLRAEPRFNPSDKQTLPFNEMSPAGRYFERHRDDLSKWRLKFEDPHAGRGGLGASSAQWALLCALHRDWKWMDGKNFPWNALLAEYRACAWSGQGTPPSGADVISQLSGGLTFVKSVYGDDASRGATEATEVTVGATTQASQQPATSVRGLSWSFPTMAFTLFRTGKKLATHEHLKSATLAPYGVLRTIVLDAEKAFMSGDENRVAEAVRGYAHVLREAGLTADSTEGLLGKMRERTDLFWAVKGCGAMGADVILALHSADRFEDVEGWAREQGIETCGSLKELTHGLEVAEAETPSTH